MNVQYLVFMERFFPLYPFLEPEQRHEKNTLKVLVFILINLFTFTSLIPTLHLYLKQQAIYDEVNQHFTI